MVKLIEVNANRLKVEGLDPLEGTPLLDIKPYLPEIDAKAKAAQELEKERIMEVDLEPRLQGAI